MAGCVKNCKNTTPEKLVNKYYNYIVSNDMQSLSEYMHSDELDKFKNMLQPVFLSLLKNSNTPPPFSFTNGDSLEIIYQDSSKQFFERFMRFAISLNPGLNSAISGSTIEPIGHVKDGDVVHVVVKFTLNIKGMEINKLSVMSIKKDNDEWKLMLTGDIKGIAEAMKSKMLSTP